MTASGQADDPPTVPVGASASTDERSGAAPAPTTIRTPDQRLRVFVSSTLEELAPERTAAEEAITQLRLTPVVFEAGARPYPPRALYHAYLAQSDVFIGLYWQRYGWVAPDMTVSGLEDEYQLSAEKPRLIYLKRPAPEREPRLQKLLDRIQDDDVASYRGFASPEELRDLIANDLALLLTERFASRVETRAPERPAPLSVLRGALPAGTVTFLFTDVEASTRLWQEHPAVMPQLIARHDALLRQVVERHRGYVFKTIGDAICAAFPVASDALAATVDGQRVLSAEPWEDGIEVHVRMALHSGSADVGGGDYAGQTLNRVARLVAAGHGGQILLTGATYELVQDQLPPDSEIRDLGEHRLKDLVRPEHIYQVLAGDLSATFPPLRTVDTRATNLPTEATPFVGRERETQEVISLLRGDDVRLLVLTGPGGTGKTRLSLRAGGLLLDDFPDGVVFVPLGSIADPSLLAATIASALDIQDLGAQPLETTLRQSLREKRMLLLLDNFEQLTEGAGLLADLLAAAPQLKVLVTSRSVLRLSAEHDYAVPPLATPDVRHLPAVETLTQYDAVALFTQRARAARPDFMVTSENAPAVAEICARLDGLPLAIELAAARIRLFPPQALLRRLESRLQTLTGGARDLPVRQQTLRNTITWSHSLLDEDERTLLRRLAVFVGGCTLEAAETVCSAPDGVDLDVLGGLASLVDQSLLQVREDVQGQARFAMLETIHEFAHEKLQASKEEAELRARHAHYVGALVEEIEPRLWGLEQVRWIGRLVTEQDNVRAALRWLLDAGELAAAGRLLRRMIWFWWIQGQTREARRWAEDVLAMGTAIPPLVRARASLVAGTACVVQGDDAAMTFLEEARTLAVAERDPWIEGCCLMLEGFLAPARNDTEGGIELMRQAQRLLSEAGDEWGVGLSLSGLTALYMVIGRLDDAERYAEESDALARRMGDVRSIAQAQDDLGLVALMRADRNRASVHFRDAITLSLEVGHAELTADILMGMAVVTVSDEPVRAARHFGAAEAIRETAGVAIWPPRWKLYNQALETARAALGAETVEGALAEGRAMTLEQAVEYSLEGHSP